MKNARFFLPIVKASSCHKPQRAHLPYSGQKRQGLLLALAFRLLIPTWKVCLLSTQTDANRMTRHYYLSLQSTRGLDKGGNQVQVVFIKLEEVNQLWWSHISTAQDKNHTFPQENIHVQIVSWKMLKLKTIKIKFY